jgi:hypothetical protein
MMFKKLSSKFSMAALGNFNVPPSVAVPATLIMMIATSAGAQLAGKGSIVGVVSDPSGAVVPGATITATNTANGAILTRTSTGAGDFTLSPLDAGIYTVVVTAPGFEKITQQNVHVNALEVFNYNPALTIGGEGENITVSAAPPAIQGDNATLGATLEQETYAALPIQVGAYGQAGARRATDFVALLPGVQFNETNGNATTNSGVVNGGGARGAVSDIYINGMPFISAAGQGDPRFVWSAISVDAVDQLQVQTSGYSAIYEGQGVQNYTIKTGSNKFHGALYEYFRNTALDTWGFFAPGVVNPLTGKATKPAEHQNEYGLALSGPILHDRMFLFGNYSGYRYSRGPQYAAQTLPNTAEQQGAFTGIASQGIYDPASCPNGNNPAPGVYCQRTRFGGGTDVIPLASQSKVAQSLQSFLPPLSNQGLTNNYIGGYKTGLSNFTATGKFDYTISGRHQVSFLAAAGRQSTTAPAGQTSTASNSTTTFNQAPPPYIDVQEFAPKTKVLLFEDNYTFTPRLVNQFKYGFARYFGPTFNLDQGGAFAASANGITGLPAGQSANSFPNVRFTGTGAPNYWGYAGGNVQATNAFTLVDNLNYVAGKHNITVGLQMAWLQYNYQSATTGTTPLQVTFTNAQTGCYADVTTATKVTSTTQCYTGASGHTAASTIISTSGLPYASFLVGAANAGSFTNSSVVETGARFRPISPYIQDDWKVTSKLTLNLGLRWDYYPSYTEAQNRLSFMNPTLINPVTGTPGALQTAGSGVIGCNCTTPVHNYMKNFGPRLGLAYSFTPQTVVRASYGVIYAHGGATGGSAVSRQGTGLLGYAASPSFSSASAGLPAFYLDPSRNANGLTIPAYTLPGVPTTSAYGTGFTTTPGYTGSPQSVSLGDTYYGDRAPQFINYTFGIQQSFTKDITLTANYVGSKGHFLQPDSMSARGIQSNQVDPKYLSLGANLSTAVSKLPGGFLASNGLSLPYANFDQNQTLSQALRPFAQYNSVSDAYGFVANSTYNALQLSLAMRANHGTSFMVNYVWSKNFDDAGTFRSGYDIPAAYAQDGQFHKADSLDRSLSLANQPQHLVVTGVFDLPFGKGHYIDNKYAAAALGGFKFSTIFMAYSGSPLAITAQAPYLNTMGAGISGTALPFLRPGVTGARKNGRWGQGTVANSCLNQPAPCTPTNPTYIDAGVFAASTATDTSLVPYNYMFSTIARTSPLGLQSPANYNLDISLRRSFGLHFKESAHVTIEGDLYNVTNHTAFGGIGTVVGSSNFGQVSTQSNTPRDAQVSARIEF